MKLPAVCCLLALLPWSLLAAEPSPQETEAATRLQIFLDRVNFSPGKIDGRYGDFTLKALAAYRAAQGSEPAAPPAPVAKGKKPPAPDVSGLDLASVEPVFIEYTITEEDAKTVGSLPGSVPAKAKVKWLPYASMVEAVAEKFHSDPAFLAKLNGGKAKALKVGDVVKVPNVEPFEIGSVKDLVAGSDVGAPVNEADDEEDAKPAKDGAETTPPPTSVTIDTKTNLLQVHEAGKVLATYPVTIGSARTTSPIGDWKVRRIAKLPWFRYDKAMLNHGKRSGDFHNLPPGPNNPVGVMWIALNKKGIGLHGTESPDTIGRASSHGCIRLANWDVVRLATKLTPGTPVSIH